MKFLRLPDDLCRRMLLLFISQCSIGLMIMLPIPKKKTEFIFKYIYFNTATSKLVQDILFKLEFLKEAGHSVNILWYYEQDDEDMYDPGT